MNKHLFFILLLFLIALPIASAVPPFQTSSNDGVLTIKHPPDFYFAAQNNFTLNFHVFNSTDYLRTNSSCNCTFHLYDNLGNHIIENNKMYFNVSDNDFKQAVSTNVSQTLGTYSYIMQCVDVVSDEAGFLGGYFIITERGTERIQEGSTSIAIILFVLLTSIGFYVLPFTIKFQFSNMQDTVIREWINGIASRGCWTIATYLMTLNSAIISTLASQANLYVTKELFMYMWLFGIAGYLFMAYLVLRMFFDTLGMVQTRKARKQRGEF